MLIEELNEDLVVALKARNKMAADTLRLALTAIRHAELAPPGESPSDDAVREVLTAELRRRHEAADIYENNDRPDAAARERAEADVLAKYLPAALSDAEVTALVAGVVADLGASTMADMGAVMRAVKDAAQGRAEGARLAAVVRAALGG